MIRYGAGDFEMNRLAIHEADIKRFRLPPLKVKATDSRASALQRQYGSKCVELNALPPNELRRRIKEAVHDLIDWEAWNRAMSVEAEEESLTKIVTRMTGGRNGGMRRFEGSVGHEERQVRGASAVHVSPPGTARLAWVGGSATV